MLRLAALACATLAVAAPASAAAHDAPLAYVEAMETHLQECPSLNGYAPDGTLLSHEWEAFEPEDALLAQRVGEFMGDRTDRMINVNLYRKEMGGIEVIQLMAGKNVYAEGVDPNSENLKLSDVVASEFSCITLVPDLPFMPGGALMDAVFGKAADSAILNSPGDTRTGAWVWNDLSPTHIKTVASYTDSESAGQLLAEDRIFYRGFYISSLRRFTPDQPTSDQPEESETQ